MLCWAVQARAEDVEEVEWLDKEGNPLQADRWWHESSMEEPGDSHCPCMGMQVNIWERAKYRWYMQHFLVGSGKLAGGYDALNHQAICHGDAGKLGKLDILSVLPEKVPFFCMSISILYEYHGLQLSRGCRKYVYPLCASLENILCIGIRKYLCQDVSGILFRSHRIMILQTVIFISL